MNNEHMENEERQIMTFLDEEGNLKQLLEYF